MIELTDSFKNQNSTHWLKESVDLVYKLVEESNCSPLLNYLEKNGLNCLIEWMDLLKNVLQFIDSMNWDRTAQLNDLKNQKSSH